jgi:predicted esterase
MRTGRLSLYSCLVGLVGLFGLTACTTVAPLPVEPVPLVQVAPPVQAAPPVKAVLQQQPPPPLAPPIRDFYLHVPPIADTRQPLTVLVVLHGMGGNGPDMARDLVPEADRNGWLLVAPTIDYRDWRDPEQVRRDGSESLPALKTLLDSLPSRTGLALNDRVLLYGFSRGGQTAHRFALFYPDSVLRVASFSCGTYTLPAERVRTVAGEAPLEFPYGVGDLARYQGEPFDAEGVRGVQFWLGVGARDNQANEVPRQWDPYLGTTRVERAQTFVRALDQLGVNASLNVFPGAAHEITPEMRSQAVAFLGQTAQ